MVILITVASQSGTLPDEGLTDSLEGELNEVAADFGIEVQEIQRFGK